MPNPTATSGTAGSGTAVAPQPGHAKGGNAAPPPLAPFTSGAHEHVEGPFSDVSTQIGASAVAVGPVSVPAYGYLRDIILHVAATGGADSGETVAAVGDAPWCALQNIQFTDVNGAPIVGPFTSAYALYLINKYGGYQWSADPNLSPSFSAVAVGSNASGNFSFLIRIPAEIVSRDALGALPNQNAASTYKIQYTVAASSSIYSTPPDTLPIVRVRMYLEAWSQPLPTTPQGMPQATVPPALGTTQYWSMFNSPAASGQQTILLPRVGNLIRRLIFVSRDSSGVRLSSNGFPDPATFLWDTRILLQASQAVFKEWMFNWYGYGLGSSSLDNGVFVIDFAHDLTGKAGEELRDQYLPTTQATRLELQGVFGSSSSSLDVITNDIAPTGDIQVH